MQENYEQLPPIKDLNQVALTPLAFLMRTAQIYRDTPAIIYGTRQYTWHETGARCRRLAAGLKKLGVEKGSTVAMLAANTPELVEAHFAVPMSGGVLNTINIRLVATDIAYILEHGDAKILLADTQFSAVVEQALALLDKPPLVVDIVDEQVDEPADAGKRLGDLTWEELLQSATDNGDWGLPASEWDAITLNYTSGTSGRPKGVVYHHRGAYLMAMGTVAAWQVPKHPRYLYTVPLFHCNGWGHAWTMCLMGGTLVCTREISAAAIFNAIRDHRITHFGAAPIVLAMLANAPDDIKYRPDYTVQVMTAGAPPPSRVLEKTAELGFNVMHVYGLTETYGHVVLCDWQERWAGLSQAEQAEMKARQGVRFPMTEAARVIDIATATEVSPDGQTMGEIVIRGNTIMKGYYKNPEATAEAFKDGWFHSGDLAVVHPDGYIEIKDRLKDIIISGGENISSIEIESTLYKHPKVAAAAVVAKADEKWGETPCAFIELKPGETATADEIIDHCLNNMARFKRPRQVIFMELPKTSTGKIQKFKLREQVANETQ